MLPRLLFTNMVQNTISSYNAFQNTLDILHYYLFVHVHNCKGRKTGATSSIEHHVKIIHLYSFLKHEILFLDSHLTT